MERQAPRIRDLALGIEAAIILFHPYDKWGFASVDQRHDVIDTWNMKTYFVGCTTEPVQRFQPEIAPGVMRFVKVQHPGPGCGRPR